MVNFGEKGGCLIEKRHTSISGGVGAILSLDLGGGNMGVLI